MGLWIQSLTVPLRRKFESLLSSSSGSNASRCIENTVKPSTGRFMVGGSTLRYTIGLAKYIWCYRHYKKSKTIAFLSGKQKQSRAKCAKQTACNGSQTPPCTILPQKEFRFTILLFYDNHCLHYSFSCCIHHIFYAILRILISSVIFICSQCQSFP